MANMAVYNEAHQWLNDYRSMLQTPRHNYAVSQIKRAASEQRANLNVVIQRRLSGLFDIPQYEQSVTMLEAVASRVDYV